MSDVALDPEDQRFSEPRFYYGWVNVLVAALAMIGTLPGRTQGLGLITEPMLNDLHLGRLPYATMNGWATLIGSVFALACGPLIDRLGARVVLTTVVAALAATVLAMSRVTTHHGLLVALVLTRGFGQSALSVVSLTIVGKWFVRRLPVAMGVYSILISLGFIVAFVVVDAIARHHGWRVAWSWIGWSLVAMALAGWLFVRPSPEAIGIAVDGGDERDTAAAAASPPVEFTLPQALRTPAFWAFALSGAIFALVSTGLMLFNEAVLVERGFTRATMVPVLAVITFTGLFANFLGGWLAERWPIGHLMGAGMFFLAASLLMLPLAHGLPMVYGYALAIGIAGGVVMVVFFVCWGKVFGRRHLGSIQGAAQILTVLGSAAGPIALQMSVEYTHTSATLLFGLAPAVVLLGAWCMLVPAPQTPRSGLT